MIEPITITKNGEDSLVLVAAEEYDRLRSRDRLVLRPEEMSPGTLTLIEMAEVPPGHDHLDMELTDWRP